MNKLMGWMTKEILCQTTPKGQSKVLTLFIEMGNVFVEHHNFNTVYCIVACLAAPAITKIKSAWSLISKKSKEDLVYLTTLMDSENRYVDMKRLLLILITKKTPSYPPLPLL